MNKVIHIILFFICCLIGSEPIIKDNMMFHPWNNPYNSSGFGKLGDWGFPTNPMNDRAIGFLLKGKAKTAVTNYGEFIEWDVHPAGLWGDWTYLPDVAFIAGVPGQSYSYRFNWYTGEENACPESGANNVILWCSHEVYLDDNNSYISWYDDALLIDSIPNYVGVIFEHYNDQGFVGEEKNSYFEIDSKHQWVLDDLNRMLIISLEESSDYIIDPNNSNAYGNPQQKQSIGLIYPWALRPKLQSRLDDFDLFDYGDDNEEWTDDDDYSYYGANVAESWFTRWNPSSNTDWQPATGARSNTHNNLINAGEQFGNEVYVSPSNTFPLLAHSEIEETWPEAYDDEGNLVPIWPGGYAESYSPEETNCALQYRWNDECWLTTDRFISNQDVYMEFDDRWAHRGSNVNNNIYEQAGYPMGLKVMASAHSYSVAFAEDIMFVTVDVRNESGDDWIAYEKNRYGDKVFVYDNAGNFITGDAMVMPDGTKLNHGKGFKYRDISMGFYMDADVVSTDIYGGFGVHTNADDFMEYYDCANPDIVPEGCEVINDDTLRVSVAMIYDYDGVSGVASNIGIVATQLLDSPFATEDVDLNGDGYPDIYTGDKLKMTDWHWFDWYNRPGVVYREGDAGCCAGDPGSAQATNKEEIQYKLITGDTTNLTDNEKDWFFHTANPTLDSPNELNPHFDSLEGLALTTFFEEGADGLDCVLQMSSGPFSLDIGEQVPFSFCIIFGQNKNDLINNAQFAQLMYNSHYQGYTEPDASTVAATFDKGKISLTWDKISESSTDVVTGYSDFEGYKIYKSIDGGSTWGSPQNKIYDNDGNHVGWVPYAQFHLTPEQDSLHCVYSNNYQGNEYCSNFTYTNQVDCIDIGNGYCSNSEYTNQDDCINIDNGYCSDEQYLNSSLCEGASGLWNLNTWGLNEWLSFDCGDDNGDGEKDIRGYSIQEKGICGPDPHKNWFSLGNCNDEEEKFDLLGTQETCENDNNGTWDTNESFCYYDINHNGQWDEHIGIVNEFIDYDVLDGVEYTYSITAYDMGISPDYILDYNSSIGTIDTSYQSANPLHFASPSGYEHIEGGKGTSNNDKNFVTLTSGPLASQSLTNNIKAVPNPYIIRSGYNEDVYTNKFRFNNLPEKCTITIFTISGEKVNTLTHDDPVSGSKFWNLRTINNQVIAPGLYIFVVVDESPLGTGEKFIGKFAIVR